MSPFSGPTVGQALARPHNGFSSLRLALALMVVVSHAFSVVSGNGLDSRSPAAPASRSASTR